MTGIKRNWKDQPMQKDIKAENPLKRSIEKMIYDYELSIDFCQAEINQEMNAGTLEIYIKGKIEAYKSIIEALKKLLA